MRLAVAALTATALLLAGCSSYLIEGSGTQSGVVERSVNCPSGVGKVSMDVSGTGSVEVLIQDGNGEVIFVNSVDGSATNSMSQELEGTAGTWKLKAGFSGPDGNPSSKFSGTWEIDLTCD